MHVIIVPGKRGSGGQAASLSTRHIVAIVLVGILLLPALIGVVAYRLHQVIANGNDNPVIASYYQELRHSRAALSQARDEASRHLNVLAQRLGGLQAQILRLNALGSRLTRMAGLDMREFNFDALPAMGGPERNVSMNVSSPDVVRNMELLARELERSQARLAALESLLLDRKLTAAVTPSAWPVDGGWVSSGFGIRMDPFTGHQAVHEGVDIAARFGGPIYAASDGVVNWAADKVGYGLVVEVTHESGLITRYAHTSQILVKEGDRVSKGQEIARVGTTGRSTGPHLHFEVRLYGQPVNPRPFLEVAPDVLEEARINRPAAG
jgi:murein DD-endopeptidase MepM/ murein hydrolase activator NlpD